MILLGRVAWFVVWFLISAFVILPLKPIAMDYGALYGPNGAALAGAAFGITWFTLLAAGMNVVKALIDVPSADNRSATLGERLGALALWQKGLVWIASVLFGVSAVVCAEMAINPEFVAVRQAQLSRGGSAAGNPVENQAEVIPDQTAPGRSHDFDPANARPLTPDELNDLGLRYLTGQAPVKDDRERFLDAINFLTQAAEGGSIKAQHNLGVAYSLNQGGAPDNVRAMKWLLIARANGSADSINFLNEIAAHSSRKQIAQANGMAQEWWSAHLRK
jgi:hypothetical protein